MNYKQKLQDLGYEVTIRTQRYVNGKLVNLPDIHKLKLGPEVNPRGGTVKVEINFVSSDGDNDFPTEVIGESVCSLNDNFERKIGIGLAVKRAVDQLNKNHANIHLEYPEEVLEFDKDRSSELGDGLEEPSVVKSVVENWAKKYSTHIPVVPQRHVGKVKELVGEPIQPKKLVRILASLKIGKYTLKLTVPKE